LFIDNLLLKLSIAWLIVLSVVCHACRVICERAPLTLVMVVGFHPLRDDESDDSLIDGLMVRIDELDKNLMLPCGQTIQDDRLATRVCPMPGHVVYGHMDVSDTRGHRQSSWTEHWDDVEVFCTILNNYPSF
jgi:hypothetical protein